MKLAVTLTLAAALLALPVAAQQRTALTWATNSELETLDPYATSKRTSQLVIRNVLENLIVRDPATGKALPALATAWKWVDPVTLELTLRRGVLFHDGSPFTADDVVYTVDYIKNPANNASFAKADYGFIKQAVKVDDFTIRMVLEQPTPSAAEQLSQVLFILPKAAHEKMGARAFSSQAIGTGPMKVEKFEPGRQLQLVRHDKYYEAAWGKPRLERLNVVVMPDAQTQVAELTAGRVDFLWNIQADQKAQLQSARNVETVTGGSVVSGWLSLDAAGRSGANPLQDKNMRLAITHALDRNALAKVLRGEASEVLHSPCNPRQFGCVQDVVKYDHNIAKAKQYLAKVNVPKDYEIKISAYPENATVGEAIAGELRNIGLNAKLDARETSAWVRELFAGRSPAAVISWPSNGVYDVVALTPLFFQGDQGDYTRDPAVMEAFKKAATLTDEQERLKLYGEGFKRLADEAFVVPLMTGIMHYAYRRGLDFTVPVDGYPILYMTGWK